MSFEAFDNWWWPYLFIILAGWLATDIWRFIGVYLGDRIDDASEALVFVRALATALVAAVIANLVVFPAGPLADTPLALRIGAMAFGFVCYMATGKSVIIGILAAEAMLLAGIFLL